ncbi:roundabout homolog 1-like [Dendronephthya gigantea]|uniref:roundabout homolog 1-like n=1 Tax=Dendronephthya gigantea TaxID=151771 RepID=UPI00106D68CA|nr:roundabout homolog 1-like [Dendronephthya gigantea]
MSQHHLLDQNATSATLELKNVSILKDSGYYRCVATNPLLPNEQRKSQEAFLTVQPKDPRPRIEIHPVNTISPIRRPLRLDCVVVGVPPPVVFWLHNNARVHNTSNRKVYPNGSLVILSLSLPDNGHYSCNGTNSKGSVASFDISLNVAYIDFHFKRNPANQTVVNGSRVEQICDPPNHFPKQLQFKWYRNYRTLRTGGRDTILPSGNLVISPVLKEDEGVYFCAVWNDFMETRSSTVAHLTVNVPPYFLTKPSGQTVILGQTLHMTCKTDGDPKPQLTWHHGNMLLGNTSRLTLGADGSLVLSIVNSNDAGQYKCSVKNVAGDSFALATVVVHVPPNGTIMPSDTTVVLGSNATFLCLFAGHPRPVTKWYFKRANERTVRPANTSSRYIQSDGKLVVLNVNENDNGLFTCVGENAVGSQNFSASLTVLVPARLVKFPRNTTVNESGVADMTCSSHGHPEPQVTWSTNGTVLANSSRITLYGGNLQIRNVKRGDTGWYSCTARNYLNHQTASGYLTVQVSPTIQAVLGPPRVQWKKKISFYCKADGVPTPLVSWLKDMIQIQYDTEIYAQGTGLHITSAGHNHTGNYTCEASNVVGSVRQTKELIVEVPPSEPNDVIFGKITSTSIQVLWLPGFNGYSPITSYKLEIRMNTSDTWNTTSDETKTKNFTFESLRPFTLYHVRVFARNKIGWSRASESAMTRTDQDSPSSPTNLRCQTINSSAISVNWDEPFRPNGVVRQYMLQYGNQSNDEASTDVSLTSLTYFVKELKPFTRYRFRVRAATGDHSLLFWGNYSSYVTCQSGQAAPTSSPRFLRLSPLGPKSIKATWQEIPRGSENGIVMGYDLQYRKPSDQNFTEIFVIGNGTLECNITNLDPYSVYEVRVVAKTVARGIWGSWVASRTLESVPSGRPRNVIVNAISSSNLSVNWDPPLLERQNGVIRGYVVFYKLTNSSEVPRNETTANRTSVELSGLMIFTSYTVQIRAFTKVGLGPHSDESMNRTLESFPGPVANLIQNITTSSIIVSWQPPRTPNGIITHYTTYLNITTVRMYRRHETNVTMYNVTSQSREITTVVTRVVLNGRYGNVTYSLCVAARTSVGYGPCSPNLAFTTNFTKKPFSQDERFTSSIVDDHLPLIAGGAAILFVFIIAITVCCFIKRKKRMKDGKEIKQSFNFQRGAFSMDSFDDGESSYVSHSSKPINAYSVESSSVHSQTNPNNAYAIPEGHDGPRLGRLRNNSITLGSEASSYDAPYSTIAEIGIDPATVTTPVGTPCAEGNPRQFVNALYTERELEDDKGETGTLDSCTAFNPVYEPSYPQQAYDEGVSLQEENAQGGWEDFPEGEGPASLHTYGVLVLPPPPPEYSDYSEDTDEFPHAYTNAVTDF